MNKIDKRTGEAFPSVLRRDAANALNALPQSDSQGHARRLESLEESEGFDTRNDWTLTLDPDSLMDYGAFGDMFLYYSDSEDGPGSRPMEWFQRLGQVVKDDLSADGPLWEAINNIFDRAKAQVDQELGFAEEEA